MKVRAQQNDTVDAICWRYYRRSQGMTEAVLNANPGLAERGPVLPHGLEIELPEQVPAAVARTIQLWE
ncbi:tail protein X [Atlantibacter hermannii]|uniref:tail protein X n=1 Tax=Atlantibacter hermannii TaxID=565 RepID=UPI0028A65685|nr:tail protein X [Atlantibacter hermannii]